MTRRASGFFVVEPEAAGVPVEAAVRGATSVVFDGWLGDDLVRAYPAVLATTALKNGLLALAGTGYGITRARVARSRFFRQHHPGVRLPAFWAIAVGHRPGREDIGLTEAGALVVSRRVLDVLLEFRIGRAVLAQYDGHA